MVMYACVQQEGRVIRNYKYIPRLSPSIFDAVIVNTAAGPTAEKHDHKVQVTVIVVTKPLPVACVDRSVLEDHSCETGEVY